MRGRPKPSAHPSQPRRTAPRALQLVHTLGFVLSRVRRGPAVRRGSAGGPLSYRRKDRPKRGRRHLGYAPPRRVAGRAFGRRRSDFDSPPLLHSKADPSSCGGFRRELASVKLPAGSALSAETPRALAWKPRRAGCGTNLPCSYFEALSPSPPGRRRRRLAYASLRGAGGSHRGSGGRRRPMHLGGSRHHAALTAGTEPRIGPEGRSLGSLHPKRHAARHAGPYPVVIPAGSRREPAALHRRPRRHHAPPF